MAALLKNVDLQISKGWKHFNGLVMRFEIYFKMKNLLCIKYHKILIN